MKKLLLFLITLVAISSELAAKSRVIYRRPYGAAPWYWYPPYAYAPYYAPGYYGPGFGISIGGPYAGVNFGFGI